MDDEQAKSNDQSTAAHSHSEPMASSDQSASSWDDLASKLGAKPSPDALERPHLESTPLHQETTISEARTLHELTEPPETPTIQTSATQPSDWAGLADSLGITADSSPESSPPALDSDPDDSDPDDSGTSAGSQPQPEASAYDSGTLEAWDDHPSLQEEELSQITFAEELDPPAEYIEEAANPVQKGLSGEVARGVFDALFLSGTAAAEALGNLLPSRGSDTRNQVEDKSTELDESELGESEQSEQIESYQDELNQDLRARDRTASDGPGRRPRRRRGRGRRRRGKDDEFIVGKEENTAKDASRGGSDLQQSELKLPERSASESELPDSLSMEEVSLSMGEVDGSMGEVDGSMEEVDGDTQQQKESSQDVSSREAEPSPADSSDESAKSSSHRRRPRRRRGRRGRGVATRETDDPSVSQDREASSVTGTGHETSDSTSTWEQAAPRDDRNRQGSPETGDEALSDEMGRDGNGREVKSEEHEISNTRSAKRPSHRNIPSWEEAMGMIVDSNIESRKKSPTPSSRSGSSRSRGRSGRRRKKT
jgi:hypothetical protein